DERPLADGAVAATPEIAEEIPVAAADAETMVKPKAVRPEPVEGRSFASKEEGSASTSSARTDVGSKAQVLAPPAVRALARDLGIDLAQLKTASDRIRQSGLGAFL